MIGCEVVDLSCVRTPLSLGLWLHIFVEDLRFTAHICCGVSANIILAFVLACVSVGGVEKEVSA